MTAEVPTALLAIMLAGDVLCIILMVAFPVFLWRCDRRNDASLDRQSIERREIVAIVRSNTDATQDMTLAMNGLTNTLSPIRSVLDRAL